jgi:hypothetical protein
MKVRRLLAHQGYFGLEARAFHVGAKRTLERMSAPAPKQARIDAHSLAEDFRLDAKPSGTLLRAFLAGGLLHRDGTGGYCVTERFREYALACVVVPLSRARAKALIDKTCGIAARINADWARTRHDKSCGSGSYMSVAIRRDLRLAGAASASWPRVRRLRLRQKRRRLAPARR